MAGFLLNILSGKLYNLNYLLSQSSDDSCFVSFYYFIFFHPHPFLKKF